MADRSLARLAWSLCGVALVLMLLALVLIALGWSTPSPRGWTPWRDQAVALAGVLGAPVLGGLIASRRPRNPYGWLWLAFGTGLALQGLAEAYGAYMFAMASGTPADPPTVSRLLELGGPLSLSIAPFLLLLFPTGRLPSGRWRLLAWSSAVSGTVVLALNLIFYEPDRVGGVVLGLVSAAVLAIFTTILLAALSLVIRYRRAGGVERQQLKWFALAAVFASAYVLGFPSGLERLLGDGLWNLLGTAANTGLYLAVGVAILKYRLYDIDVVINRALVYGALTAALVAIYFGGVAGGQTVFRALTGQEQQPQFVVVGSTLIIAALFSPLRRRVQGLIDRRFYRQKYDAVKTLEAFSAKLRDETDLELLEPDLLSVVSETVQPDRVSLWLKSADGEPK